MPARPQFQDRLEPGYRELTDEEVREAIKDVDTTKCSPAEEVRDRLLRGIAERQKQREEK